MAPSEGSGQVLASLSNELANAVERAGESIVTVHGRRRMPASGIVWPGSGIIVTADHVLERDEDITVTLSDGTSVAATVAGRDPGSDIAVLRLASGSPTPATLAPGDSLRVGHFVLALGKPGSGSPVVSFGVVSAQGGSWRTARGGVVDGYIRADLTLYPGFSGGALVDTQGRVVGLNSSHLARGQELAIPSHVVDTIAQTLLTQGRIRRGFLGVSSQPVLIAEPLRQKLGLTQESGLMVLSVEPGSPAETAGLVMGDVLVALAGQKIADAEDLQAALGPAVVGVATPITIVRGGQSADITVTPGERA
jgi:S1-C subfamily serine protease